MINAQHAANKGWRHTDGKLSSLVTVCDDNPS